MTATRLAAADFADVLRAGLDEIERVRAYLSELDSIGGDGDHGTAMHNAIHDFRECGVQAEADMAELLNQIGNCFLAGDGGASGGLLGSFFLGAGSECAGVMELDTAILSNTFRAGLQAMQRYTKAKRGDKTMLDALEPAVLALAHASVRGDDLATALEGAAQAAAQGASETKTMQARFGRAQYAGPRTIGWQDPGATTVALLFKGFASAMKQKTRTEHG
jgi:phosphoenolpyruvate---glycerone phosphotransferase subunit DhaL